MKSFPWWSQVPLFRIPASCRPQLTWLHRSLVGRLGNRPLIRSTPCLQHSGLLLLVEPSQVCTLIYDAMWTLLKLLLLLLLRHFYLNVVFFLPIPLPVLFFFLFFVLFYFFFSFLHFFFFLLFFLLFFVFFFFFYVCLVYSIIPSSSISSTHSISPNNFNHKCTHVISKSFNNVWLHVFEIKPILMRRWWTRVVLVMFTMIILMITPMIEAIKGVSLSKRLKQLRVIKMTYKNVNIVTK